MPTKQNTKAKQSPKQAAPVKAQAAPDATAADTLATKRATRDAKTIAAYRTHFGAVSSRDEAYAAFYRVTAIEHGKPETFTLAQLAAKQRNPLYAGSNKASDAGAINRARKAGHIAPTSDACDAYTFTDAGAQYADNVLAKLKAATATK